MSYNVVKYNKKSLKKNLKSQIELYTVINKMISHLNVNGKKIKLIKLVFKFFQKNSKKKYCNNKDFFENLKHTKTIEFLKSLKIVFPKKPKNNKKTKKIFKFLNQKYKEKELLFYNTYNKVRIFINLMHDYGSCIDTKVNLLLFLKAKKESNLNLSKYYYIKLKTNNHYNVIKFLKLNPRFKKTYNKIQLYQLISNLFYSSRLLFETKKVRKGPKYYDVPCKLKNRRSLLLVLRWFSKAIKEKNYRKITDRIQSELDDFKSAKGSTFSEVSKLRKKVLANLMFSHYRWWNRKKKKK